MDCCLVVKESMRRKALEQKLERLRSGLWENDFRHMAIDRARGVRRIPRVREIGAWTKQKTTEKFSGGDALRGHTRSHPEHDG